MPASNKSMKYNLCQFFLESKNDNSDRTALVTSEGQFTYLKLWEDIRNFGLFLKSKGIKRGDRIMVVKENGYATIVSFWAILFCGGIVTLFSHKNPLSKLISAIQNCEPHLLILDDSLMVEKVFKELLALNQKFLTIDFDELHLPNGLEKLCLGALKKCLKCSHPPVNSSSITDDSEFNCSEIISEDIAAILYTSGSTGDQKGVVLTHGNMIFSLSSIINYLGLSRDDTIVSTIPLTFDYGLYQMLMGFSLGAQLVLEEENIWSIDLLRKVEQYKGTVIPVVPTLVTLLSTFINKIKFDLSSVRMVTSTAERLKLENIQHLKILFPKAQIFSMYGLTECKRCTFVPPHLLELKKGSSGKAIPNSEIRVIDSNGYFIPPFIEGELVLRGANVMRGYWRNPEETNKAFYFDDFGNKWLRTGDYGYLDEEGYFFLQGRRDSIVKVRGMKVSLIEVEEVIAKCPHVHEVGVVMRHVPNLPEQIIAFISKREDVPISETQKYCKENLRDFQIPAEIKALDVIPKNINGKIDRKALTRLCTF